MTRQTTSHYRLLARRVIRETLEALPPTASLMDKRRALRAAGAPFRPDGPGQGLSWPYKCWLREMRLALGAPRKPPQPEALVAYVLAEVWRGRPNWIVVRCDWCAADRRRDHKKCLLCGPLWDKLAEATADPAWRALREGGAPRQVLADWLEERDIKVMREGLT